MEIMNDSRTRRLQDGRSSPEDTADLKPVADGEQNGFHPRIPRELMIQPVNCPPARMFPPYSPYQPSRARAYTASR